jgi:hypothetical protein
MEMELVHGDAFLGFALCLFFFFLCVHIVGASDGIKFLEAMDKKW